MILSAEKASVDSIQSLPWWAQLLIGVGLTLASVLLHMLDKKTESEYGFLEIVAFLVGCGGLYVTAVALF